MKIYTICDGRLSEGAEIESLDIKSAGIKIPVIAIGEHGRGRKKDIVPVHLSAENHKKFIHGETVNVFNAYLGKTQKGKPKLFECGAQEIEEEANHAFCFLAVLRTPFGFRGSNSHTGDRDIKNSTEKQLAFLEFPAAQILASGTCANGDAGGMASGDQHIVVMPIKTVFRTGYTGRRYGSPHAHYYYHDGSKLISVTWEDRLLSELF